MAKLKVSVGYQGSRSLLALRDFQKKRGQTFGESLLEKIQIWHLLLWTGTSNLG